MFINAAIHLAAVGILLAYVVGQPNITKGMLYVVPLISLTYGIGCFLSVHFSQQ